LTTGTENISGLGDYAYGNVFCIRHKKTVPFFTHNIQIGGVKMPTGKFEEGII
jgi:hypothetical protein